MFSIRQRFRAKHQVLVLKCYPPPQKDAIEYKPNSSELSYLLYYASTRHSKLRKVGDFLQRKTDHDVYHARTGEVQITLQIIAALIERCPRELPLFSYSVLSILSAVLKSKDATMVEASLPTFDSFCAHYNPTPLAADHNHTVLYDEVVNLYASYASKTNPIPQKGQISVPLAQRYRTIGLKAIKTLVSSEPFQAHNERHLRVLVPVLLQNLDSDRPKHFSLLRLRENTKDKAEREIPIRRRTSVSISRNTDSIEVDPEDAAATTAHLDEKAEEEVAVLALQALRQIFTADDHSHLRSAARAMLHYILVRRQIRATAQAETTPSKSTTESSWCEDIFELACEWTAVQHRYTILLTITDSLFRSPITEHDIANQLLLTKIVAWLLRSPINFYGLSVIDILVGFIQHTSLLLQLQPADFSFGHPKRNNTSKSRRNSKPASRRSSPMGARDNDTGTEIVNTASPARRKLLDELQNAIGDMAVHNYYLDQVGDMVSALLERLKPAINPTVPHAVSAIENPVDTVDAIAASVDLQDDFKSDPYFSFNTARLLALGAVRKVLLAANARQKNGSKAIGRNRVGVSAWDGTQWLLRDPDGKVRKAYVGALLMWLDFEVDKNNLGVVEDSLTIPKRPKKALENGIDNALTKRAISNASKANKPSLRGQSTFLQLLHLAIYENAHQYAESEPDIELLHLLLQRLVKGLGVNSARHGLPMMFRLQEDIQSLDPTSAKIAVGSLVHGYLLTLSEIFDFETTAIGQSIISEVNLRKAQNTWLNAIRMPAIPLQNITDPSDTPAVPKATDHAIASASLRPFDARNEMVELIAESYSNIFRSPPSSPPMTPRQPKSPNNKPSHNRPMSSNSVNLVRQIGYVAEPDRTLPDHVKLQMLTVWSKEACIAAAEAENVHPSSISGSKTGSGSNRQHLTVNGTGAGQVSGDITPVNITDAPRLPPLGHHRKLLRDSPKISSQSLDSMNSSREGIPTVDDLKKILAMGYDARVPQEKRRVHMDGTASVMDESDSMVSAEEYAGSV